MIIYKLTIQKWVKKNLASIENKSVILFTVSGASSRPKLDGWIADSLPADLISQMQHVALRGRLNHKEISWWTKFVLKIGAWKNDDPEAKKEELEGFNFMDKASVEPILKLVQQYQSKREAL